MAELVGELIQGSGRGRRDAVAGTRRGAGIALRLGLVLASGALLASAALAPLFLFAAPAQAGEAVAGDNTARIAFDRQVDGLYGQFQVRSAEALAADPAQVTGQGLWFDPKAGQAGITGAPGYSAVDMAWAKSTSLLGELLRSMGGNTDGQRQLFQREADRYYAGLEGLGGQWFSNAADAQGYFFRMLLKQSNGIPGDVKDAVAQIASNDVGVVVRAALDALERQRTFVSQGGSTQVTLTSTAFAAAALSGTDTPVLYAGKGVRISNIARGEGNTVTATVSASADAVAGASTLLSFRSNSSFLSTDHFPLFVVADAAAQQAAPVAVPGYGDAQPLDTSASGTLRQPGDQALYSVTLASAGQLDLATSGPSDVALSLEKADGSVLAANDDGGPWYNAKLSVALAPGTYFVRVAHCCQGTGAYALTSSFTAN